MQCNKHAMQCADDGIPYSVYRSRVHLKDACESRVQPVPCSSMCDYRSCECSSAPAPFTGSRLHPTTPHWSLQGCRNMALAWRTTSRNSWRSSELRTSSTLLYLSAVPIKNVSSDSQRGMQLRHSTQYFIMNPNVG